MHREAFLIFWAMHHSEFLPFHALCSQVAHCLEQIPAFEAHLRGFFASSQSRISTCREQGRLWRKCLDEKLNPVRSVNFFFTQIGHCTTREYVYYIKTRSCLSNLSHSNVVEKTCVCVHVCSLHVPYFHKCYAKNDIVVSQPFIIAQRIYPA